MKTFHKLTLLAGLPLVMFAGVPADGATLIVGDNYNVTGSGSGFALNTGVNSGINPPTTRLTGSAASNLRYINTGTKVTTAYTITSNKLRVTSAADPGRFTFSSNGTSPFDFGPALGVAGATPSSPVVYDLSISMDNDSTGILRCSFALGVAEGDAFSWDFGFQVYRASASDNFYTIGKRIDTKASGLASDLNAPILTMGANTYGTEITILMRVTDAGSESTTFNSRVQLSLNGGSTWFYDTATDPNLTSGWRLNGAGRVIMCDVAPSAGNVTYDNFSLNWNSGPRTWTGGGTDGNWNTIANWGSAVPVNGSSLTFSGTTRQSNTNNITGLVVPWLAFNNGGFGLYGNTFTNSGAVTNLSGVNTFQAGLAYSSTATKTWSIASGSEVVLGNTTAVEVNGDHGLYGGGTLRLKGAMNIGQTTAANPAFVINEGKNIIDGGTFASGGSYRIGAMATGSGGQTVLTNGASLTLTAAGANLRVGDSANPAAGTLVIDNSSLTMSGGVVAIPFAAGAIGAITQNGGTVSGGVISFSEGGAGTGTYTINNGTLEPVQIREVTAAGTSTLNFNNAILRAASGANSTFLSGLNTAQIQAGGLTFEVNSDVTVAQVLSGSGVLTKTGNSKVTFTGANSYTGNTVVNAGTLALGTGGSIASSPTITLANGTTLDVSAITYSLAGTQTIARNATNGNASINGSATLSSGAKISLQMNGSGGSVGTLSVAGGLTLNANVIAVNITSAPLGLGTYPLITYTGSKSGSFNPTPAITGTGLGTGLAAKIVETAGQISLKVYVPAHGIAAANIKVIENDLANTVDSVVVSSTLSINGLQVRDGSSRGDYTVQVGTSATDDVANGILITSVAENGRDHGEDSGTNFCTSALSSTASGYFIPTASAPGGTEYNINVSAAYFPYAKYLGGLAKNSAGTAGGANNQLTGSPGLVLGTHFVDNGSGVSTVNLTSLGIDSRTDGILLATAGSNGDNYALTVANTNNGTWNIYVSDNGTNGAVFEQDAVAFVYIPRTNVSVISGKFKSDGTILMYNGDAPRFSVVNTATGVWQLSIPGYTPNNGVLVLTTEADGANQDNIVSYQPSGSNWIIQSRDVPGNGLQTPPGAVASFVFIPAPTATLVSPANNAANIASAPSLKVNTVNPAGGNVSVTYYGHQAPKPYPGKDFTMVVMPDTQNYAREAAGSGDAVKEMWFAQTDWIVDNQATANIAYVAQLGDIVQNGDTVLSEWRNATNAMYRLEKQSTTLRLEGIPYGMAVGNHDQEPNGDLDGTTTRYNQYFGSAHFAGKSYYGGHFSSNNDNHYDLFSASGLDFIVIYFEFDRYGSIVMDWANDVVAAYPNRRIIVVTHHAGSDSTPSNLSNSGDAIFANFKANPNYFLLMGGHVFNGGGEGSRSDTFAGHTMRTLVSDYQGRFNGGNGLMRLMTFSPSNNVVSVKTYSPWTGNYETDADSQFSFSYNMALPTGAGSPGTAYVAIGTNATVAAGAQSSLVWSGLVASKKYEWYVVVTDEAGDYSTSAEWAFTTTAGFTKAEVVDTNKNGISDSWESQYGVTNPDADDDGDGQSNRAEYLAHTDPSNSGSLFKILEAKSYFPGQITLKWTTVGGVRYRVQYQDADANGNLTGTFNDLVRDDELEIDPNMYGTPSTQTFVDNSVPLHVIRYYRIKVEP